MLCSELSNDLLENLYYGDASIGKGLHGLYNKVHLKKWQALWMESVKVFLDGLFWEESTIFNILIV